MNFEKLYNLSNYINKEINLIPTCFEINFKISNNEFSNIKDEIKNLSSHTEEKDNFNNKELKLCIKGIKYNIINYEKEVEEKLLANLKNTCEKLHKNGINLDKIFFTKNSAFQLFFKENKNSFFTDGNSNGDFYIANEILKKRHLLTEKFFNQSFFYDFYEEIPIKDFFDIRTSFNVRVKNFLMKSYSFYKEFDLYNIIKKAQKQNCVFILYNSEGDIFYKSPTLHEKECLKVFYMAIV